MQNVKTNTWKPSVSVIVPVYNTKDYLEKCLNSLRNQTLYNIEVVMIEDGSFDGSEKICDYYSEIDFRFSVFHKNNEGLAAARNNGISLAHADYVMFVDSDDWVEPEFCKAPFYVAQCYDVDVVAFQYLQHGRILASKRRCFPVEGIVAKKEVLSKYWSFTDVVVWNKLYRKELFKGIQFPVGHLCEDGAVTHLVVHKANTIYLLNKYLYNHLSYRFDSISNQMSSQFVEDAFNYGFDRINNLKKWGYNYSDEEMKLALLYLLICGRDSELSNRNDRILHQNKTFPRNASLKQKIMFHLYKLSPELFDIIAKMSNMRFEEK